MHYLANSTSPYNVGGITKAGEVYRLFNKAFASGRTRLDTVKSSGLASYEIHTAYDPLRKRYHVFSANDTSQAFTMDLVFTNTTVPVGNRVLVEEVSESYSGTTRLWTTLPASRIVNAPTQTSNSVWLVTACTESNHNCEQYAKCGIRDPLWQIKDRIVSALEATSIAGLASEIASPPPSSHKGVPVTVTVGRKHDHRH